MYMLKVHHYVVVVILLDEKNKLRKFRDGFCVISLALKLYESRPTFLVRCIICHLRTMIGEVFSDLLLLSLFQ